MSELSIATTISRQDLGLEDLDINDGVAYRVGRNLEVNAVSWRREAATSPFVHGRIPVIEVKDAMESSIDIYVLGEDHAELDQRLKTLLDAFTEQYSYTLRLSVDGYSHAWSCERADYSVGFATEFLAALTVPVRLTFHRHPNPLEGAF